MYAAVIFFYTFFSSAKYEELNFYLGYLCIFLRQPSTKSSFAFLAGIHVGDCNLGWKKVLRGTGLTAETKGFGCVTVCGLVLASFFKEYLPHYSQRQSAVLGLTSTVQKRWPKNLRAQELWSWLRASKLEKPTPKLCTKWGATALKIQAKIKAVRKAMVNYIRMSHTKNNMDPTPGSPVLGPSVEP
ncbi:hypothetical protein PoB_006357400 [Plakobranchus ocellatus]|uniref:Uncharacterized protein n=1 Tax=Plakobranchus ocellatus TaxID=259542 RepID=A0AAV4CZ07_9GAST|nr:hypothetical protein PoB_006357400 [Plakobranchus ocellatus]